MKVCFTAYIPSLSLTDPYIDLDDLDLGDDGYDAHDKITRHEKQPYEVDFKVCTPKDIDAAQVRLINEVKDVLGQPPESAAILLRYFRWNREKLIEQYMEKQSEILEAAGLGEEDESEGRIKEVSGFMCDICCDDSSPMTTFALKCGHRFCVDCYKTYLDSKVKYEGEAARIKCPGDRCNRIVDSKSMRLLMTEDLRDRCV
jgi:ariadne-1